MALLDEERRVVDVNGACVQLVGRSRQELIGTFAWEAVVGGPVWSEREWRAVLQRPQVSAVADIARPDGSVATVEVGAHPEVLTGRRLILLVVLKVGRRLRPSGDGGRTEAVVRKLSQRESEVVALLALGHSGPEIADELSVSHNTVRTHVRNAMEKLGARTRAQLVAIAMGEALCDADRAQRNHPFARWTPPTELGDDSGATGRTPPARDAAGEE
jgi:PAS domain S-box-containing protein